MEHGHQGNKVNSLSMVARLESMVTKAELGLSVRLLPGWI